MRDIAAGRSVALVSDAGTPAISDPGARLVRAVAADGHRVVPLPGASAVAAAVSAAGLDAESLRVHRLPAAAGEGTARDARDVCAAAGGARVLRSAAPRCRRRSRELGQALEGRQDADHRARADEGVRDDRAACRSLMRRRGLRRTLIARAASSC